MRLVQGASALCRDVHFPEKVYPAFCLIKMRGKRGRKFYNQRNKVEDSTVHIYPNDLNGWLESKEGQTKDKKEPKKEKQVIKEVDLKRQNEGEGKKKTEEEMKKETKEEGEKKKTKPEDDVDEDQLWEAICIISISILFGTESFRYEAHKAGREFHVKIANCMSFFHLASVLLVLYLYVRAYVLKKRGGNNNNQPVTV